MGLRQVLSPLDCCGLGCLEFWGSFVRILVFVECGVFFEGGGGWGARVEGARFPLSRKVEAARF